MSKNLLMIHGVGCDGTVWDRVVPLFDAAGFTCHAPTLFPDKRRRVSPPESLGRLTFADYVEAMAGEADALARETGRRPAVIGHSMGGLIAQKLAERGLVDAAVFLTPASPKGARVNDPRVLRTFWAVVRVGPKNLPGRVAKVGPKGFSWGVLNAVPRARHEAIHAQALFDSGQVYADLLDPPAIVETRITTPTLTIGAGRDRATPVKGVRKVARKYAGAAEPGDYLEYPENAHWILDEPGTDEVFADIITWLARKLDKSPPKPDNMPLA